jgi:hypothetical protein
MYPDVINWSAAMSSDGISQTPISYQTQMVFKQRERDE